MDGFKSDNFNSPIYWLVRGLISFGIGLAGGLVLNEFLVLSYLHLLVLIMFSLLIFLSGQVDEVSISSKGLLLSQRSIFPFLRSERYCQINSIKSFKKNSRYVTGGGLNNWSSKMLTTTRAVEVLFKDGSTEIINGRNHPEGLNGVINEFKKLRIE